MTEEPLLSYEDISLYTSDLLCLEPGQWLNDQIISFAMARIEKSLSDGDVPVRFLDASLVSCLRLQMDDEDEDEVQRFVDGIGLNSSASVIVPVTNKVRTTVNDLIFIKFQF